MIGVAKYIILEQRFCGVGFKVAQFYRTRCPKFYYFIN